MNHSQLIDQIVEINRSARAEFLAKFNEAELQEYLDRLQPIKDAFAAQFQASVEPWSADAEEQLHHELELAAH